MRPTRPPIKATSPPRLGPNRVVPDSPQAPGHLWRRLYVRGVDDDLGALHSRDIGHGGTLGLRGLDGLDEERDSRPTPEVPYAPKYLVYPPNFGDVNLSAISPRTQVIDFGQSFDTCQRPPPAAFGIPANYAAPEVVLDSSGSIAMDRWSLGCTLYEIRLGWTTWMRLPLSWGSPLSRGQNTTNPTNPTPERLYLFRLRGMREVYVSSREWNVPVLFERNSPVATTVPGRNAPIRGFSSFQSRGGDPGGSAGEAVEIAAGGTA
ncbi:Uncharacterized protein TPAR_02128 [Tolypocladium paradoxum]|uniref:Protein kinase domain-containing protein n=1 Tax=Tolypocladium paradoxum TaxID=94208 RepID=A0A2S4L5E7_9HYPO|nr:Uncharacterized protein TPAR_02128 [Tolypocladium paradoxum]